MRKIKSPVVCTGSNLLLNFLGLLVVTIQLIIQATAEHIGPKKNRNLGAHAVSMNNFGKALQKNDEIDETPSVDGSSHRLQSLFTGRPFLSVWISSIHNPSHLFIPHL